MVDDVTDSGFLIPKIYQAACRRFLGAGSSRFIIAVTVREEMLSLHVLFLLLGGCFVLAAGTTPTPAPTAQPTRQQGQVVSFEP